MAEQPSRGYKIIGVVTAVKGHCGAGHKVGDKMELSVHNTAGLCGILYHDISPLLPCFSVVDSTLGATRKSGLWSVRIGATP